MSSPIATVGLLVDDVDVQDLANGIFLEIVRGLNETPEVRGTDVVVPGLPGRIARNRVADRLTIELSGFIFGVGTVTSAPETAGGADTTLVADTLAGALEIEVDDATDIAETKLLRVGDTGETEIRTVGDVTGTTITLTAPLMRSHDSGDQVREVDSVGSNGDEASFRANVKIVRGLFDPTSMPLTIVAALEDGTVATILARPLPSIIWDQSDRSYAAVSIELESTDPDWVIA